MVGQGGAGRFGCLCRPSGHVVRVLKAHWVFPADHISGRGVSSIDHIARGDAMGVQEGSYFIDRCKEAWVHCLGGFYLDGNDGIVLMDEEVYFCAITLAPEMKIGTLPLVGKALHDFIDGKVLKEPPILIVGKELIFLGNAQQATSHARIIEV